MSNTQGDIKDGQKMKKTLKMYYTSDTHGYLFPTDYVSRAEKNMGVISCIKEYKKDGNTLVLDAGDTIQGSAFVKYMWEKESEGCTIAEVFNAGGYDYVTLGNHDFNNDYSGMAHYLGNLNAQCIVANVIDRTEKLGLKPYVIHTLENGLKVGIVGIVTDYVTIWEKPEHLENFEILDTFTAAKEALEEIKDKCDIKVCLYHGGYECDLSTGKSLENGKENVGYRICQELEYDVLLTGHQHMPVQGRMINGTYTMQVIPNAQNYGFVTVEVNEDGTLEISSENVVPSAVKMEDVPEKWAAMQADVQEWLDQKLGGFTEEIPALSKLEVAVNGSRLADFCNQIQLEETGADFSCIGLGNNPIGFDKEVTTREVIAAYQFPNTIKVLEVDEAVIRKALERCAEYFSLQDGEIVISEKFLKPKVTHYNYDFFAGFSYTFDISRPEGERVVDIKVNGEPLGDKKYTLAMSDYRSTGTGGYDCYKTCPVVKELAVDIQELAIEYIKNHEVVQIIDKPDFKIIY